MVEVYCVEDIYNATSSESYDDDEVTNLWMWGVLMKVISTTVTTFGTILQKCAHIENEKSEVKARECFGILANWYWFASFTLMVLVPLPLDLFAYSVAPQSLIAPLAGLTIIQNQVFGPFLLKETLTRTEIIATMVILLGN